MAEFILAYSLQKLIRLMEAGTIFMGAALLTCRAAAGRMWRFCLCMLSLVPLACLMGYSKLFYTGKLLAVTNFVSRAVGWEIAAFYFGIAGMLAVRFLHAQYRLRKNLKYMQPLSVQEYPYSLLYGRGPKISVYLSQECQGPFAGGIVRPYIVVPKDMKSRLSKAEFYAVLYHEALHIRGGHIWILNMYAVLKILWWAHPLIYLCDHKLRENIEYASDEGSVALSSLSAYEYAAVMIKALQERECGQFIQEGITAFSSGCFEILKKRIIRLGAIQENGRFLSTYQKKQRIYAGLFLLLAAAGIGTIAATSFPRYTVLDEICVYDDKLHPLTYNLEESGFHADIEDGSFRMGRQELDRLVHTYGLEGPFVVFSYGTIMKVPGAGGLGQAAVVNTDGTADVRLLAKDGWIERIQVFVMKYLI